MQAYRKADKNNKRKGSGSGKGVNKKPEVGGNYRNK